MQSFEIGSLFSPLESEIRAYALNLLERSSHLSSDRPAPSVGSAKTQANYRNPDPQMAALLAPGSWLGGALGNAFSNRGWVEMS